MAHVLFACFLVIVAVLPSACSPPHAVRIKLPAAWQTDVPLQVYLRQLHQDSSTFSETDFIIKDRSQAMVELLIMLENAEGDLDVSVSNIDTNGCKVKYAKKRNVPLLPGTLITDVHLHDVDLADVQWPARCNCYLSWCKAQLSLPEQSEPSSKYTYLAVTGFRKSMPPEQYRIWVASEAPSELFEIIPSSTDAVMESHKLNIADPEAKPRSLVIGKERDPFLWVLSQQGVYRKNIANQEEYLQPWNKSFMPADVALNKIAARTNHTPGEDKIYVAGFRQGKGTVLHFQDSSWPDILDNNEKLDVNNKNLHGLWLGINGKRVVAVGQSGTAIEKSTEASPPIDKANPMASTQTLNTVTCIDATSTKCWVAGTNGTAYLLEESAWKPIEALRARNNKSSLNTVNFNASLSIETKNPGEYMAWIVGTQGTVLFFNGGFWRWLQVKERASGQDGENGQGVDLSNIAYRDIWAADEQNVWIVGSSGQVRVSDPTIPL